MTKSEIKIKTDAETTLFITAYPTPRAPEPAVVREHSQSADDDPKDED